MARPRSFDEATVLAGAMHAFRRTGFGAASIKELEQATGLAASSLYNAFGDKRGLFDAAFEHYLHAVLQHRIATHAAPASGLAGVRTLFATLLAEPRGERHGCLITNTAIEFGAGDEQHHRMVARGLEILRVALRERLSQAAASGLLAPAVDPAVAAVKLVALYQGVLVLVRSGFGRRALERAIHLEFDSLERT